MADEKVLTVADVRIMLGGKNTQPTPADAQAPVEPVKSVAPAELIVDVPPTADQLQYNVDTSEPAAKPVAAKALKTDKKGG